jgi:DNA-binding transcriptional regulator WhiA
MGPKVYTVNEAVFDTITEESAYWLGFLMADGSINTGKTGNPRIALTLAERDREHLVKFRKFLNCSNQILFQLLPQSVFEFCRIRLDQPSQKTSYPFWAFYLYQI